ncbi:MAG: hypothetical protein B6U89_05270 [Desulfurococcales archaeon ex4484_58]|nr:MAG: hypothetical protein B6U89_05270 [Desulfurococcales archaeon ex4484_58]
MKKRKRKLDKKGGLIERRRKIIMSSIIGVVVTITLILTLIMIFTKAPTTKYYGIYAEALNNIIEKYTKDPRWNDLNTYKQVLHEIYYEYYKRLYNTSIITNTTFTISNKTSYVIRVFLATNETIYVKTKGNGTYYCIVSLTDKPEEIEKNLIVSFAVNSSGVDKIINIEVPIYAESFFILYTNSSKPIHGYIFINKTPPGNLTTILRVFPIEYTTWLFESWIKDRYIIKPIDPEEISETRPPWEIVYKNITEITSLEACLLMSRLYNLTGIRNHIIAVDLDGDGEMDHIALMIEYEKDPSMFGNAILNYILRDVNLNIEPGEVKFKHVIFYGKTWMVIDPLYEMKYIPAYIPGKEVYETLGIIY